MRARLFLLGKPILHGFFRTIILGSAGSARISEEIRARTCTFSRISDKYSKKHFNGSSPKQQAFDNVTLRVKGLDQKRFSYPKGI